MAHEGASRRCLTFGERSRCGHRAGRRRMAGRRLALRGAHAARRHQVHPADRRPPQRASTRWRPSPARSPAACRSRRSPRGWLRSSRSRAARRPPSCAVAGRHAITLVDDSYNANPDSVRAAIDVLGGLPGPRLLVLGDMGEVGDQGPQFHAEVGAWARERGIETAVRARPRIGARHRGLQGGRRRRGPAFRRHRGAQRGGAGAGCRRTASVLVKGSRFMQMERVVQAVSAAAKEQQDKEAGHA